MKRGKRLIRIMAMAVLVFLVALPAFSGTPTPDKDKVKIKFAIFVPAEGKWRVSGSAAPGNTVTVSLGESVVGTSKPAGANGRWILFVDRSSVAANPGDSVTVTSIGGGTVTKKVLIR